MSINKLLTSFLSKAIITRYQFHIKTVDVEVKMKDALTESGDC